MKLLTFPDARQCTPDMCGVAATQAVLYYYGQSIIQSKLVEMMKMDPEVGVEPEMIVKIFTDKDFEVDFEAMTIEKVKEYIDEGTPVILLINAWAADYPVDYTNIDEEGHYVVAIGYDDEKEWFIFDDPSFLENRGYIGYDELLTRWKMWASDNKTILHNYGIAVHGTPLYDPQRLIHIEGSNQNPRNPHGQPHRATLGAGDGRRASDGKGSLHSGSERIYEALGASARVAYRWRVRKQGKG